MKESSVPKTLPYDLGRRVVSNSKICHYRHWRRSIHFWFTAFSDGRFLCSFGYCFDYL